MWFYLRTPKLGISKFPKLGLLKLWRPITFFVDLWSRWGLKKSGSPCQDLSNNIWHPACMQINQGNSRLLMVGNQIGTLTPGLLGAHNLCFKYSNGTCELILDIYVSRSFQWYKEFFNLMSFNPCNCFMKMQESIGIPTPKVVATWECVGSFPHILLHSWGHKMWFSGFTFSSDLCKPSPWSRAQS